MPLSKRIKIVHVEPPVVLLRPMLKHEVCCNSQLASLLIDQFTPKEFVCGV
jgi:hypothetical protein